MDRIGKKQDGDSVRSYIETKKNTSSTTTTNASKKIAKMSADIPSQRLDERITTVPNSNQASDESESINQAADVASTDESSGAYSSNPNTFSQLQSLPERHDAQSFNEHNPSAEAISETKAPNSKQRNFQHEIRNAIKHNQWSLLYEIMTDLTDINPSNRNLTNQATEISRILYKCRIELNASAVVDNFLSLFVRENHIDLIKLFLELGANANLNLYGEHCLLAQSSFYNNVEAVNLLLGHGAHVDGNQDIELSPPLLCAIASGAYDCVKLLLLNKAKVNYCQEQTYQYYCLEQTSQYRPLCTAAYLGHAPILDLLLQHGAGAIKSESSSWREHPLNCAAYSGHVACVTSLLSNGYRVNGGDQCRLTPLSCAVQNDHIECAKLLFSRGASFRNRLGWNSLWSALRYEYVDRDSNLNTTAARSYLNRHSDGNDDKKINIDMVRLLLDHGANSTDRYERNSSILLSPVIKNDTVCVNLLLQYGYFSNLSSDDTLSPTSSLLEVALINKNINMVRILILAGAVLNSRETNMYVNLLPKDEEHIYTHPFCLQARCWQTLYPFVDKGSPNENVCVVNNLNLPESFKGTFHSEDKSTFFKCSS